jgi:hypothetical protein
MPMQDCAMKKSFPDMPPAPRPAADPLADAAHALLAAIEAEPVPQHLTDLARSLKNALDRQAGGKG